jgi:hypothetical protein
MYLWARSWGIQPSEFWNMTINEWWAEYDHHAAATASGKFAGKLTQGAIDELKDWMDKKDGRT